jgi:hypothetical protein
VTDLKEAVVFEFKHHGETFAGTFCRALFKRPTGIAVNLKTMELLVVDALLSVDNRQLKDPSELPRK